MVIKTGFYPYERMCEFEKAINYYVVKELVWNEYKFEMETMEGYHNLYLKCYVLFLADVFEKFRIRCWESYGLWLIKRTNFKSASNA